MPPTFSILRAEQDAVLVCTKKDGVIENFDYLPLGNVLVNGVPLGKLLDDVRGYVEAQNEYNLIVEARMQAIEDRQRAFAEIFIPQGGDPQ